MDSLDFQPPEGFEIDDWLSRASARQIKRRRRPAWLEVRHPFASLSRSKRRDAAASMSWRIQSDPNGRGVFTSHNVLPGSREWPIEPETPVGVVHWADVFFMSARPLRHGVFYNATVTTAAMVASKTIVDRVVEMVEAQIDPSDRPLTRLQTFSRPLKGGGRSMVFAPARPIPSLGGLTVQGAQARCLRDHWKDWPSWVDVAQSARFLPGYALGFGLDLVVEESNLTVDSLAEIVSRFLAQGEQEFQGKPLSSGAWMDATQALLQAHLWRWETSQARSCGEVAPELPPEEVLAVMNHESNAIRWR